MLSIFKNYETAKGEISKQTMAELQETVDKCLNAICVASRFMLIESEKR